jgi:alpha-beta hydrolase superfamily lysophospholipase
VLIHGYFDHSGILKNLIHAGIEKGYAILVYDLRGHGLSSGDPTAIGTIPDCAEQLDIILNKMDTHCPTPIHGIAHSTGCTIILEYLHQERKSHGFDTICFLAPLIRHEHWGWSKFGYTISRPFTDKVRRRVTVNSSDPEFLAFVETDPLQSPILSYNFLDSIYAWNKAAEKYPQWPGSILVIQGDQDSIVDWSYNMKFLGREIDDPQIIMIEGANHQLLNEAPELRARAIDLIFKQIEQ